MIAAYILLVGFGLAFGSFVNALVWRLRQQLIDKKPKNSNPKTPNYSILRGRSMCINCRHVLAWYDLVPVLSWLRLRGKCRYCQKPISVQYPVVELGLAAVFSLSYAFWPTSLSGGQWILFAGWLVSSVGLMALLVYDLRWMILPNKIIYSTLVVAAASRLVYIIGFEPDKPRAFLYWLLGLAVASGVFWVLFVVSKGQWIGYGDVRLGLVTGTLLATPAKSFLMIFIASIVGVVFIIPALLSGKKGLTSKLPYGPFLIAAAAVTVLFGQSVIDWYSRVFLL